MQAECDVPMADAHLIDGDASRRISSQHAAQQVSAVSRHVGGRVIFCSHDAWKHLLQPDQVVCAIVAPLCKWQHACMHCFSACAVLATGLPA